MTDQQKVPLAQQTVYVQMVRPPSNNGIAVAGLVLGAIACAAALIPLAGLALFPLPALLALIFGIVGVVNANRLNGLHRAPAILAIVLSLGPLPVALVSYAIYTAGR